jgi:hypothetical protein
MTCQKHADLIRDYFSDPTIVNQIVSELNKEIVFCPILRNLQREKSAGVIDASSIKFRDLGSEDRNEVFVYLGRILESVLTCKLTESDYNFVVKKDRTSSGDVTINKTVWEIKGTSGKNSWTGSTHASKKEDDSIDFIGIKYGINEDADVFDVLNGNVQLIAEIFIGVFDNLTFVRNGSATESNSRTSLLISVEDYDKVKNQVAWGNIAYPSGGIYKKDGTLKKNVKYLQLEAA